MGDKLEADADEKRAMDDGGEDNDGGDGVVALTETGAIDDEARRECFKERVGEGG